MSLLTAVQVIANTGGVLGIGGTPHEVMPRSNKSIVDVDKVPFKGPKTPTAKWHKVGAMWYAGWCAADSGASPPEQQRNASVLCRCLPEMFKCTADLVQTSVD